MAIQHTPSGDPKFFDLIRFFRPSGSRTIAWAQDMDRNAILRLLRWGDEIYLPVYDGLRLGIGICNGSDIMRAYPIYIEAVNLWQGGQPQPEDCDTDHMWELMPGQTQVIDKMMNPHAQEGRPLIITETGFGNTVGEAVLGTSAYRGQIRVYERLSKYSGDFQSYRRTNEGSGSHDVYLGGSEWRGGPTRGMGPMTTKGGHLEMNDVTRGGRAGIGLGASEHQSHHETGVSYQRNAQPVVYLRVEYRSDLQPMLSAAWGSKWDWFEPFPRTSFWWDDPWDWHLPTFPQVPEVKPHRPR